MRLHSLTLISSLTTFVTFISSCGLKDKIDFSGEDKKASQAKEFMADGSDVQSLANNAQEDAVAQTQANGITEDPHESVVTKGLSAPQKEVYEALKAASDKTLEILGISNQPLKELKATLSTIRTLCQPTVEDCKAKVVEAHKKFVEQMAQMKATAEKARVEKKESLDKIFEDTKNVFLQCEIKAPLKDCKSKGNKGKKSHKGYGQSDEDDDDDKEAKSLRGGSGVVYLGNGQMDQSFGQFLASFHQQKRQGAYSLSENTPDPSKALKEECQKAIEKLKATVSASSK